MKVLTEDFMKVGDKHAKLYTLENDSGMTACITNYGGAIVKLLVPGRDGKTADVVLGHGTAEGYLKNEGYLGAAVGRNSNRITGAVFDIPGGITYHLDRNDGANNLHGGYHGLSFRLMDAELRTFGDAPGLILSHVMEDGSDGFPGNLKLTVTYTLTNDNALKIEYRATTDKKTVINLTNHAYFNLGGHDSGDVLGQELWLDAGFYLPTDVGLSPTGEILTVEDTAFDFRKSKTIGRDIQSGHPQVEQAGGFDHNMVLNGEGYRKIACAYDPASGRAMDVFTDQPGVQLYTANMLAAGQYKDGATYEKHQGFCLETQTFPDALRMPWLRSPIYDTTEVYSSTTAYRFYVK